MLTHFVDAGGPLRRPRMATVWPWTSCPRPWRRWAGTAYPAWRGCRATEGAWVGVPDAGTRCSLDDALARLDTDHVDVWLVSAPGGAAEETPATLTVGARYVGPSRSVSLATGRGGHRGVVGASAPITLVSPAWMLPAHRRSGTCQQGLCPGRVMLAGGALTGTATSTPADSRCFRIFVSMVTLPVGFRECVIEGRTARFGPDRRNADVVLAWVRLAPGISSA